MALSTSTNKSRHIKAVHGNMWSPQAPFSATASRHGRDRAPAKIRTRVVVDFFEDDTCCRHRGPIGSIPDRRRRHRQSSLIAARQSTFNRRTSYAAWRPGITISLSRLTRPVRPIDCEGLGLADLAGHHNFRHHG